jgi:dipeptidyl aminopeptidase/acylaminoacyl peptidase
VLRVDAATGAVTVLTASARHLPARLSDPSSHRITTADGESVPCFVYPAAAGAPADRAGSVVLHLHGGPEEQAKRTFSATIAALTHAGHAVVVPNVRGSTGYGKRWYSMDDGRRRFDAFADLAAVHAYLPALGLDPKRAALWGASYGGYLVLAGLAFQPRLWAAGVDIVGISSLVTFLEHTSPYRRATREREYGTLARDREFLAEASPMTRIDDVRAPLFVIHGRNDPRVPVSEAAQLYDALVANGVECELHVFDDEGHGLTKRANKVDAYARAFEFLGRHLS